MKEITERIKTSQPQLSKARSSCSLRTSWNYKNCLRFLETNLIPLTMLQRRLLWGNIAVQHSLSCKQIKCFGILNCCGKSIGVGTLLGLLEI